MYQCYFVFPFPTSIFNNLKLPVSLIRCVIKVSYQNDFMFHPFKYIFTFWIHHTVLSHVPEESNTAPCHVQFTGMLIYECNWFWHYFGNKINTKSRFIMKLLVQYALCATQSPCWPGDILPKHSVSWKGGINGGKKCQSQPNKSCNLWYLRILFTLYLIQLRLKLHAEKWYSSDV